MKIDELEELLKEKKPLEQNVTPEEYKKERRRKLLERYNADVAELLNRYDSEYYRKYLKEVLGLIGDF